MRLCQSGLKLNHKKCPEKGTVLKPCSFPEGMSPYPRTNTTFPTIDATVSIWELPRPRRPAEESSVNCSDTELSSTNCKSILDTDASNDDRLLQQDTAEAGKELIFTMSPEGNC